MPTIDYTKLETDGSWLPKEKPRQKFRRLCETCGGWGDRTILKIFRIKCKACNGTGFKETEQ